LFEQIVGNNGINVGTEKMIIQNVLLLKVTNFAYMNSRALSISSRSQVLSSLTGVTALGSELQYLPLISSKAALKICC
jgi:hypothetical protein